VVIIDLRPGKGVVYSGASGALKPWRMNDRLQRLVGPNLDFRHILRL
jgi:hypothetical protein